MDDSNLTADLTTPDVNIKIDAGRPCIVLIHGNRESTFLFDDTGKRDLPRFAAVDRAVVVTRLRAFAYLIEAAEIESALDRATGLAS